MTTGVEPLRPYQEEAIKAAVARRSMLLAMVMGSGKTRVAIETIDELSDQGQVLGGAVFVQNSTKFQWLREIEKWSHSSAQVIDGDKRARAKQYRRAHRYLYNILNYETLIHDWDLLQTYLPIDFIIADECTNIKGLTAKRAKRLKRMGKVAEVRLGMSGQPIENRPEELFSIMEFIDDRVFGPFTKFDPTFIKRDRFGRVKRYRNLNVLQRRLEPVMFRRTREDIAEYMPKVVEVETPIELDPWAKEVYEYIRDDLLDIIELAVSAGMGGFDLLAHYGRSDGSSSSNRFKGMLMSRITCMRLLCDHPALLLASAEEFDDPHTPRGSQYASELVANGIVHDAPATSTKLSGLVELVQEILEEDSKNKLVIFSGYKAMVKRIGMELRSLGIELTGITGDVPTRLRDERIVKFNEDPAVRVFLSSDAGNYGISLDQGSHLISYDLPWSSGAFAQRLARIDRLSSAHHTIITNSFYCSGTIEERQLAMLHQKRAIGDAFLDGKYNEKGALDLTLTSLREFLSDGRD